MTFNILQTGNYWMHRKSQAKEVRKKAGRQFNVLSDQTEENLKD